MNEESQATHLVLVRHGLSQYNEKGLWAGWADTPLTQKGREEAKLAAGVLHGMNFQAGYTSPLSRAKETLEIILRELSQESIPIETDAALNERNYGIYTGKNKWDIKKEIGESKFLQIRRGWNESIPQGESLKQVYERVIPYYKSAILPKLLEGKNCIISSSGNALRALIKYLEQVSDEEIATIELGTGEVRDYIIGKNGSVISKKILLKNEKIP